MLLAVSPAGSVMVPWALEVQVLLRAYAKLLPVIQAAYDIPLVRLMVVVASAGLDLWSVHDLAEGLVRADLSAIATNVGWLLPWLALAQIAVAVIGRRSPADPGPVRSTGRKDSPGTGRPRLGPAFRLRRGMSRTRPARRAGPLPVPASTPSPVTECATSMA